MPLFLIIWIWATVLALVLLAILRPSRHITWLTVIASIVAICIWIVLPDNPGISIDTDRDGVDDFIKPIAIRQGLDLAGGLKVLLEAQMPNNEDPPAGTMDEVALIVGNRVDSLGALEPTIQIQGSDRLIVELPGFEDPDAAVELIRATAQLEFVSFGFALPPAGTTVVTSLAADQGRYDEGELAALLAFQGGVPFETVMTGDILQTAVVSVDEIGRPLVNFTLTPEGSDQFGDYTRDHIGEPLGIVVDGVVISTPSISAEIRNQGTITGEFDIDSASRLATQLQYGALPASLTVESISTVGPTLGAISVERSIRAGAVGIVIVMVFMIAYYRIPGAAAALALLVFALINLALYKFVPITMTLPAITGFLIGVGTAVDGNILIFERTKEELAAGKKLGRAVEAGFDRAFPSIRDSNISTIIICMVLWGFGTSFGAGAVRGFAVTLALSLIINLFTAIIVTRTFLHFILLPLNDDALIAHPFWMGLIKDGPLAQQRLVQQVAEAASTPASVPVSARREGKRGGSRRKRR